MAEASGALKKAEDHYKLAKEGWSQIYKKSDDDLLFLSDEPFAQWDPKEAKKRLDVNRPVIEVDQLSQFIHQVTNDIRMNTPTIKVIPAGDNDDVETAEALSGRVKAIEYKSNADSAYDMAADFAVKSSIGFITVDHDYIDDRGFEQELKIKRCINPQGILIDPNSIECDGSDARYGFILEEMTVADFQEKYPGKEAISFGEEMPRSAPQSTDKVVIAHYFCIKENEREIGLLDDGKIEDVVSGKKYKSTRKVSKRIVERYKFSGADELDKSTFPGIYIPIVPVYGEEAWRKGKRYLNSLIRKAKSSQTAYVMLKSSEMEILLKQQQAPVQAAAGQMRGFEEDWKNPEKAMVLYYHQTDVNGDSAPPPLRLQPPVVSTGFANASLDAENNIRKTLGMYNAGVGKREGDSSGVALKQLEMSGDVASFHFGDNLVRSVTQVGKILVSAIPEIEDTPRIVQTITKEDEIKPIGINGALVEGQETSFDFTKGKWDIRVITGPAFTTQRQEAAELYGETVKAMPDLLPIIGDLVFKYMDTPGSQAVSSRLKKLVDPKLLDESERDQGEQDPQITMLNQQLQEAAAQTQQIAAAAQQKIAQLESELKNKGEVDIAKQAELSNKEAALKAEEEMLKLKVQNAKLELKVAETQTVAAIEAKKLELESSISPLIEGGETEEAEGDQMPMDDDSIEMLEHKIAMKKQQKIERELAAQQQAEMAAQQEAMALAEREEEKQRQMALMQGLLGIQQSIGQLVNVLQQPIQFKRDEQGNIIEAA